MILEGTRGITGYVGLLEPHTDLFRREIASTRPDLKVLCSGFSEVANLEGGARSQGVRLLGSGPNISRTGCQSLSSPEDL